MGLDWDPRLRIGSWIGIVDREWDQIGNETPNWEQDPRLGLWIGNGIPGKAVFPSRAWGDPLSQRNSRLLDGFPSPGDP